METKDNYFKIVALIVEIACSVIWKYMKQNIIGSSSFETFLNLKTVKHRLVHVYEKLECCECVSDKIKGERLIAKEQLLVLYKSDETKRIKDHKVYVYGRVKQVCICNYYAKENIDVRVVDITLANYIIQKCGQNENRLYNWMKNIQEMRNEIFHLSDVRKLQDDEFNRKWEILQSSILGIANLIDDKYVEETKLKIIHTKQLKAIPAYTFNYEVLCRDYWRNKCAELERIQYNEIEDKIIALHPIFTESMKRDCQTTIKEIQKIQTVIDKINIQTKVFGSQDIFEVLTDAELLDEDLQIIHVPAFLQLDVPNAWDKTRIFEYLQDIRLSGTSDANIRIMAVSDDDLNMYTKIARSALKVDSIKREINTLLSGMLSAVAIDATQRAEVSVSLTISGNNNSEMETPYDKVLAELCQTRNIKRKGKHSNFPEEHSSMTIQPNGNNNSEMVKEMETLFDKVLAELCQTRNIKRKGKHSNFPEEHSSMTFQPNEKSEINSDVRVKKTGEFSAIRDRKTNMTNTSAEFIEEHSEMRSEEVVEEPENCSAIHGVLEENRKDVVDSTHNQSAIHDSRTRTKAEFVGMVPTAKTNYFKLVALLVDPAYQVIWTYISKKILGSYSFESFLNLNKEKHKLIHVFETIECCECLVEFLKGENLISRKQLLLLYQSDESKQIQDHTRNVGRKVVQVCICKYVAKHNIDVKVVDITLANYIILKCGKQELGLETWMKRIKDLRNEIFHISDIQEITDAKFNRKWKELKGSILGIANLINSNFAKKTKTEIQQTKRITCIPDYMVKYEILCRDYWRNKCAEFERAQIQHFQHNAEALLIQCPENYKKSLVRDSRETMEKIRELHTIIDNIEVLIKVFGREQDMQKLNNTESMNKDYQIVYIPVFLQLHLPTSWNRTAVLEYLDKMRLRRTSDMNIRIMGVSPCDLNVYSAIAKTVLRTEDLLQDEIKTVMSGMLSEAAINTKQSADIAISLTIPEIKENTANKEETFAQDQSSYKTNLPVSVKLRHRLNINKSTHEDLNISSCIKTGITLVFVEYNKTRLIICNLHGTEIHHIPLSYQPWFITTVDTNTVAVSCSDSTILIITISTRSVISKINTRGLCFGISYNNNNLYVVIDGNKIHVMDLVGIVKRTVLLPSDHIHDIAVVDRYSFIIIDPASIYCCSLSGRMIWKVTKYKQDLRRVTADNAGNIYISDGITHNLVGVFNDGRHREDLPKTYELNWPTGIYFDRKENILFVCNYSDGQAFLFDVYKKST